MDSFMVGWGYWSDYSKDMFMPPCLYRAVAVIWCNGSEGRSVGTSVHC